MSITSPRQRLFWLMAVVALFAAACGGSDSDGAATGSGSAADADSAAEVVDDEVDVAEDSDSDDEPAPAVFDGSAPDPSFVAQIGQAFLGNHSTPASSECLVAASENDADFANAVNTLVGSEVGLDDDQFAVLVHNVRDCGGADAMHRSLAESFSPPSKVDEVAVCFDGILGGDDGGEVVVSLTALMVGFPFPAGSEDVTVNTLAECVSGEALAIQLAAQFEATQQGQAEVDIACVTEALGEVDVAAEFWTPAVVTGDQAALQEFDLLLAACSSGPFEDMLQAVPADFVPWAGERALAEVAPPARANAYSSPPPMTIDPSKQYQAIITTEDGQMVLDLFADTAPVTVNSFVNLANDGYYDGIIFHRVLDGFMAQGGDPTGTGTGGPGYTFADEFEGGREFDRRGLLAMANSGPATNGSQFFITFVPTTHLNGGHTIFGELVEGDDVLAAVNLRDPGAPTGPAERIISIEIVES